MRNIEAAIARLCDTHRMDFDGARLELSGRQLYVRGVSDEASTGICDGRWEWFQIRDLADDLDVVIVETENGRVTTLPVYDSEPYYNRLKSGVQSMIDINLQEGRYVPASDTGILTPDELRSYVRTSDAWLVLTSMDAGRVIDVSEPYAQWTDKTALEWRADRGNLARWNPDSLAQTINWLNDSQGVLREHTTVGAHCRTGQMFEWFCQIKLVDYGDVRCRLTEYSGRRLHNLAMV